MDEQKLIQVAETGNTCAMFELARYYDEQSRSPRDDKVGDVISVEDFFKNLEAEEKDDPELKAKAYKYYRMAAESGVAEAMTEVAHRLYDGIGTEKNEAESDEWYRRGAEAGDPTAMRVVAFRSDNAEEKFKYFKRSAELLPPSLNKKDSIKQTAINYAAGRGTEKNLVKAEEWLAKLDERDAALTRLEIAQITGERLWLEQAAKTSPEGMVKMAESFVAENDFKNALLWYKKASDVGDFEATSIVGDIYYIGENGVEQDYERAYEYYEQAAACGYNMAAIKLALMIYHGRGCSKDRQKAQGMFRKIVRKREKFFGVCRFNSVAKFYIAKMLEDRCRGIFDNVLMWYKRAAGLERMDERESTHDMPEAMYKVANIYFMQGKFAEALQVYEQIAEHYSRFYYPYNVEAAKKIMWMNELGEGVPMDKIKAAEWRERLPTD